MICEEGLVHDVGGAAVAAIALVQLGIQTLPVSPQVIDDDRCKHSRGCSKLHTGSAVVAVAVESIPEA